MQKSSKKYHIRIVPQFLFDSACKFRSSYTKHIYIYFKFSRNIFLQKGTSDTNGIFKPDYKHIMELFGISKSLVDKCIKELKDENLLASLDNDVSLDDISNALSINPLRPPRKAKQGFYLLPESSIAYGNNLLSYDFGKTKFVQIYKNFYIDALTSIRKAFSRTNTRTKVINAIDVYFYLSLKNGHFTSKEGKRQITVNYKDISYDLQLHHDDVKLIMNVLEEVGLIENSSTVSQRSFAGKKTFEEISKKRDCNEMNNVDTTDDVLVDEDESDFLSDYNDNEESQHINPTGRRVYITKDGKKEVEEYLYIEGRPIRFINGITDELS